MAKLFTYSSTATLKTIECGTCGIPFALPQKLWESCYNEGGFFTCPLGHSRGWNEGNTKSAQEQMQEKLKAKENDLAYYRKRNDELYLQKQTVERRLAATKGTVTKLKKRVANGVCPCCNRTFQNVQRHMSTQHPDFGAVSE